MSAAGEEGVFWQRDGLALIVDAAKASGTLPVVSVTTEESVLRHPNNLTGGTDTPEAPLAPPAISTGGEEGVFWHFNGLTSVTDAPEASLTLPVISILDEGVLRKSNSVFCVAHCWAQKEHHRNSEAYSYQAEDDADDWSGHLIPCAHRGCSIANHPR
jgi:hypothetical protein